MFVHAITARHDHEVPLLRAMFEARKRVFVDLLGWDIPVLEDRYEIDQFDGPDATYLIVEDGHGHHLASARLLPTSAPHILSSLFPQLCAGAPPTGTAIREITRFCLDRAHDAATRRAARDTLVAALAGHALDHGIHAYTGVAELPWLQQILAFGWDCRPLGLPQQIGGRTLGALRIDITRDILARLAANNIRGPGVRAIAA